MIGHLYIGQHLRVQLTLSDILSIRRLKWISQITVDGHRCTLRVNSTVDVVFLYIDVVITVSAGHEEVVQELVGAGADVQR
jgi:hypothetical protein